MTTPEFISFDAGEARMDWLGLAAALEAGHARPRAEVADTFLYRGQDTLLTRSAWIDGLGIAVKAATIVPDNASRGFPGVNGVVTCLDDRTGMLQAVIDFRLVTKWKTAGDSLLGALKLARSDSREILIVGAGAVATSLIDAYGAGFPEARFTIWNRTEARARELAAAASGVRVATDLRQAVEAADILCCATMSTQPVVSGEWLRAGQHVDLVGAYRPDMREADDVALQRAKVFVDSFDTTLNHIGELKIPLETGAITREHVVADFYEMAKFGRAPDDITIFKNGGGAHLDLMTSRYILDRWSGT